MYSFFCDHLLYTGMTTQSNMNERIEADKQPLTLHNK
jgi:hypothetical protein